MFEESRKPKKCSVCHEETEYWNKFELYDNYWDMQQPFYICNDCLEALISMINEWRWLHERKER